MRVVEITESGGPNVLQVRERPVPKAGDGEVVLRIAYAGVNRPDALQRAGMYDPPPQASDLPGLEASGEVVQVGKGVSQWSVGDRVCALLPGGGYAQYAATPVVHCLPIPKGMSMRSAACLPETFFTVWSNVFMRGGLRKGEKFLVHGGAGGIGTTAIQLAKAMHATVFATASTEAKRQTCRDLGADLAIDYTQQDFVEIVRGQGGADVILDMVGGDYIPRNLKALAEDGRLVQIAFLSGAKVELNFASLMMRRLTITGSTLRPQSDNAKSEIANQLLTHVWPLLDAGEIAPVMDREFDLSQAADAHRYLESNEHIGKIVLHVFGESESQ
ncbi:Phthiocerol synthesis polyketide synthase type I PpsC [Rubripirellula amarantea]|uniref:Phthiocerol synthesis polyketide synthase type I PpsC n=1 Tax=Rubripirellula amarantea TaxID=2527999 RepID=A0A5C5WHB6_9BACT|nr:NAD(P)H-quinone oxidoreductase [Rubripirellula amarantea]TWT50186.1 Phthiocerol synthesis polyketide synthase type I PpsC [Rubripirellula amarantea]